jgi:hypothetical protein
MSLRLLEMRLERLAQIVVRSRLGHFRQRFGQLFLGVIQVSQFVNEHVLQCHGNSSYGKRCGGACSKREAASIDDIRRGLRTACGGVAKCAGAIAEAESVARLPPTQELGEARERSADDATLAIGPRPPRWIRHLIGLFD